MNIETTSGIPLRACLILGLSSYAVGAAHAEDPVQVTAANYVRAESDFQMKGYIESYNNFGKFEHFRKPYDVENKVNVRGNGEKI